MELVPYPPKESWQDWAEIDPKKLPKQVVRHYSIVPTVCFNCEAGCGLLAYVDKETFKIRKLEGNPLHPGSRGKNCAKGPATINQINNPDRILYPLKRVGSRGGGKWERVKWEDVIDDLAIRIRKTLADGKPDQISYHVGRPGEDLYTERVLQTWGLDGHNSHTNVCSAGARTGYAFWMGMDRPNPDYANAKFILMLSSHLEAGHYFNPHAQRIIESKMAGTKIAVVDPRLSNTASKSDYWLSPYPGTEGGLLLAVANQLIQKELLNNDFLKTWVNWEDLLQDIDYLKYLKEIGLIKSMTYEISYSGFIKLLKELYREFTPNWAEKETGVKAENIIKLAEDIGKSGTAFATHVWRSASAAHLGGWMVARALFLLNVLTGSVATHGGTIPNHSTKFVPKPHTLPTAPAMWNENHYPLAYPLAHFEMSFLLPYILKEQNKHLDVYFTRVYNPVWTNPDGFSWIEMLSDEQTIGLHVAMTPVWSETAQYADYILPMGLGPERHDLHSYETHNAQWIALRQPVIRVAKEIAGEDPGSTLGSNPGEVWEENEFWIELSWKIDPDGDLGIRKHYESPYRPGEKITINEYYKWIFENSVPGLKEAAGNEGLTPLEYMRRYGAFEITQNIYEQHNQTVENMSAEIQKENGFAWSKTSPPKVNLRPTPGPFVDAKGQTRLGININGDFVQGFPTPSGKLEFFSQTLKEWGWPEYALPFYPLNAQQRDIMPHIVSQVHPSKLDKTKHEYDLLPTFRLPNLIHSRTNGAKWLYEISQTNPVWINPIDAKEIGVETGDLVKVETGIGYFVDKVWATEALRPGVVACSHHLGRWRLNEDHGSDRWNSSLVKINKDKSGWYMKQVHGVTPFDGDKDSNRIWWSDGGVHQNLTFPVQADPISGQHCWHQKVSVTKAPRTLSYGDVFVDSEKAQKDYDKWLDLTRPAPGPENMRRPYWLLRPLKPGKEFFKLD